MNDGLAVPLALKKKMLPGGNAEGSCTHHLLFDSIVWDVAYGLHCGSKFLCMPLEAHTRPLGNIPHLIEWRIDVHASGRQSIEPTYWEHIAKISPRRNCEREMANSLGGNGKHLVAATLDGVPMS